MLLNRRNWFKALFGGAVAVLFGARKKAPALVAETVDINALIAGMVDRRPWIYYSRTNLHDVMKSSYMEFAVRDKVFLEPSVSRAPRKSYRDQKRFMFREAA